MPYIYQHALVSKLNGRYRLTITSMSIGQCCIQGVYVHWKPGDGELGRERG